MLCGCAAPSLSPCSRKLSSQASAKAPYASHDAWRQAVAHSNVRLQWDPDHDPAGAPQNRRALRLGLRGDALSAYGRKEILEITDISAFVAAQRTNIAPDRLSQLLIPVERVYLPESGVTRAPRSRRTSGRSTTRCATARMERHS